MKRRVSPNIKIQRAGPQTSDVRIELFPAADLGRYPQMEQLNEP